MHTVHLMEEGGKFQLLELSLFWPKEGYHMMVAMVSLAKTNVSNCAGWFYVTLHKLELFGKKDSIEKTAL